MTISNSDFFDFVNFKLYVIILLLLSTISFLIKSQISFLSNIFFLFSWKQRKIQEIKVYKLFFEDFFLLIFVFISFKNDLISDFVFDFDFFCLNFLFCFSQALA